MTDRGKRIPLEKRINLRVIMGRAAFAVVAAAVFWLSGRAPAMAAQEPEEGRYGPEIRITRNVEPAEDGEFQEPPDRYWDGDGPRRSSKKSAAPLPAAADFPFSSETGSV